MGYPGTVGRHLALSALLVSFGCSAQLHDGGAGDGAQRNSDAGERGDGPTAMPDAVDAMIPLGPWSTPTSIPGGNSATVDEDDPTLNSTRTELYFAIADAAGVKQLYFMTRASPSDPWGMPTKLDGTFNTAVTQESPRLSPDDLTIYFGRNGDIYSATRQTVGGAWTTPAMVTTVSTANYEKWMAVCAAGYFMVSRANGANGQDLFEGAQGEAGTASTVLNSTASEISTFLSADCLTVYFASNRGGTTQMYTSTRAAIDAPWVAPTEVDTFGAATDNEDAWISTDQRTFVFASIRGGGTTKDLYISTR